MLKLNKINFIHLNIKLELANFLKNFKPLNIFNLMLFCVFLYADQPLYSLHFSPIYSPCITLLTTLVIKELRCINMNLQIYIFSENGSLFSQ